MVRDSKPEAITLAIGDGANDVNMITGAHIGVGIKGLEGSQAARISDFAIGEFKLLRRLVLAYGRECYRRNCDLVGYFFYKNLIIVLPQIWIAPLSGFSGQVVYETFIFEFYNISFTSIPILVYALIDWEFDLDQLQNSSSFYKIGQKNERFNTGFLFMRWISRAAIQSLLICSFGYITIEYNFLAEGMMFDYWTTGMAIFTAIVIVANLELFILHNTHTFLSYFFIYGSIAFYFGVLLVFSFFKGNPLYQILNRLVKTPQFYLFLLASIYLCNLLPASINKVMRKLSSLELFDKVTLGKGLVRIPREKHRTSDFRRRYTGFAYSG
jgi:phospholipid-transporting ATPase